MPLRSNCEATLINIDTIEKQNLNVKVTADLPEDLLEWNFNAMEISDKKVLVRIICKLFDTMFDFADLHIDRSAFEGYISEVSNKYHDRPFHNFQHAATVTHMTYMLMNATDAMHILSAHQRFALLLSAVVHDVDHPGNTNGFEINTNSALAIRYNDQTVLENHHCSTAFLLTQKSGANIFENLSDSKTKEVRKMMIACILATDMLQHSELLRNLNDKVVVGWNFDKYEDVLLYGKMILHAADLSNPVRPFFMSVAWAKRVYAEFNQQVVIEKARSLPVFTFMETLTEEDFVKKEFGFVSIVVAPMWRDIGKTFPGVKPLVDQLECNLCQLLEWKTRLV
jgi:hypothetical protein